MFKKKIIKREEARVEMRRIYHPGKANGVKIRKLGTAPEEEPHGLGLLVPDRWWECG